MDCQGAYDTAQEEGLLWQLLTQLCNPQVNLDN